MLVLGALAAPLSLSTFYLSSAIYVKQPPHADDHRASLKASVTKTSQSFLALRTSQHRSRSFQCPDRPVGSVESRGRYAFQWAT